MKFKMKFDEASRFMFKGCRIRRRAWAEEVYLSVTKDAKMVEYVALFSIGADDKPYAWLNYSIDIPKDDWEVIIDSKDDWEHINFSVC